MDLFARSVAFAVEWLESRIAPATINLAKLGASGTTLFGAEANDNSGGAVSSAGDVNGDGFDDLLIGAALADAAGNLKNYAGETYVIFGGPSQPSSIDLANLGSAGIIIFGADTNDQSGSKVSSAGDVNDDGFDDILIGAPFASAAGNAKSYAGESYVVFGGAALPATIDLASLGAAGVTIFGADAGDQSGSALSSAGDVNDDGFDDIVIGALFAGSVGNTRLQAGESYVIFGGGALPATIDLASLGAAGRIIFGAGSYDRSGYAVRGAGDVNGDGFDDVIVGAPHASAEAGGSYVVFGGLTQSATVDLASLGTAGIAIFGIDANDFSGSSVSGAGDVNGDGFGDIIIGAYNADGAGNLKDKAGESYVVFGSATPPSTINLASLGSAGITLFGIDSGDYSGCSVSSAGDVNGDGFADFLIGASYSAGAGDRTGDAGETYLVFGGASLPAKISLARLGSAGITIFGIDAKDYSGSPIRSAGDVNGDGFSDLIIGAKKADAAGNIKLGAGESYVIYGSPGGKLDKNTTVVREGDGDIVSFKLNGGKLTLDDIRLAADGTIEVIDLTRFAVGGAVGKALNLTVSVKTPRQGTGDGFTRVGFLNADGVQLGKVKLEGDLRQFIAGTVDTTETSLKSLTLSGVLGPNNVGLPGLALGGSDGALPLDPALSQIRGSFGKLVVGLDFAGARVEVGENVGNVTIRGAVLHSELFAGGQIGSIKVLGQLTSDDPNDPAMFAARNKIGKLVIDGNVQNALILIGYDKAGNTVNPDASLGTLMVKGSWMASSLAVGVADSTSDGFGRNDTAITPDTTPTVVSKIASIVIKGPATGSAAMDDFFGFTAQKIGKLSINKTSISLQKDTPDDLLLDETNEDFRMVELG
jgi:hypothetical protein